MARALEDEYDLVMPDARGHGASSTPPYGYRYEDHASDVLGLIEELGLEAPALLGHSMGGMVAAIAAGRLGARSRGVVLVDPTFLSPERQREVSDSGVAEQHRRWLGMNRVDALAEARARHPRRAAETIELAIDARRRTRPIAFDVLTPPNPEYRAVVRAIQAPILLVVAGGGVVSLETARELQEVNPRLRFEHIEDAGHGVHYDQPERFEAVVRSFLRSIHGS